MTSSSFPDVSPACDAANAQAGLVGLNRAAEESAEKTTRAATSKRSLLQVSGALVAAFFVAIWRAIAGFFVSGWRIFVAWCRKPPLPWRYRAHVISRTLVGAVGGFYLAVACATLSARGLMLLELSSNDARLSGQMLGFLVQAIALMWAFGCASQRRAWLGVGLPAVVLSGVVWWLQS